MSGRWRTRGYRRAIELALLELAIPDVPAARAVLVEALAEIPAWAPKSLEPIKCEWCGRVVQPSHSYQRFCSTLCRKASWRAGQRKLEA
jgi:hypothetical protein